MIGSNSVDTLLQMAGGYCLPRSLHVVAELSGFATWREAATSLAG